MKQTNQKITATVALALTIGASTLTIPKPAEAQILELATGALNALFNRPPKPIPNQNYAFGTSNLNGNNFNFCLFPCTPGIGQPSIPQAIRPTVPSTGVMPSSGSVVPSGVPGVVPPGVTPSGVPPQTVQPTPPRPTVVIPPIKLPINLPF
ncbi:hypothetical protein Sta7437_2463 [Stanieria cyanosphaera PCC 7437]|uniref:Uncharacterized protein n=1 Tax=Stanieria cyanosphaera (strain ATCC 29371 / PCC 7437) TaxID=111780 RepID=K9XWF6_STAC7|nr:hypothetical protein [Stanieria cyanosphaera]AFZ35997.1 hypothetical protein Sta7437_2463 [Stanieria cyanosphaera PCC 7437]